MTDFSAEIIIIGAGAIGLAIARSLTQKNYEVIIVEEFPKFGQITSSRNSGVIHAGIYYSEKSLKAKMCVEGNIFLYEYCKKYSIPFRNTKKILVASNQQQIQIIDNIKKKAEKNGVEKIEKITKSKVLNLEPLISCQEALLIHSSGIIDTYSYMNALEGEIKDLGGMISYNSKVIKINYDGKNFRLKISDTKNNFTNIDCKQIINSAGLSATDVAKTIQELDKKFIPRTYYAKGNYFSLNKDLKIKHLIYPIPDSLGLGIHLTLNMDNKINFGPDVEWVDNKEDYKVSNDRKEIFANEISKYLPSLDVSLLQPNYSGIRPIINKKDKSMRDFIIQSEEDHNIPGLINLFGIDSPGLTASLSLANFISNKFF